MQRRPHPRSGVSRQAIAWALLSQSIWLPLVAIDAHDRWQSRVKELQPERGAPAAAAVASRNNGRGSGIPVPALQGPTSTGLLLGTGARPTDPLLDSGLGRSLDAPAPAPAQRPQASLAPPPQLSAPVARSEAAGFTPASAIAAPTHRPHSSVALPHRPLGALPADPLLGSFRRSELLGGALGLADLQAPRMPTLAMAERARWSGSNDPLAPLPSLWREPMRRALQQLPLSRGVAGARPTSPGIQSARVVHLPSSRISRAAAVPLAIQSDGSVDILSKPSDPGVIDEVRRWSTTQSAPGAGTVTPAVVYLSPLPKSAGPAATEATAPARPSAAPAAASARLAPAPDAAPSAAPAPTPAAAPAPPVSAPAPVQAMAPEAAPAPEPAPAPVAEAAPAAAPAVQAP
ncbi:MAG: hypothetical protein VKK62_03870 [Synechococcaceae cyanobacterium]|nr:hypothetical protein [Synechococcaceae cyanobacterium]